MKAQRLHTGMARISVAFRLDPDVIKLLGRLCNANKKLTKSEIIEAAIKHHYHDEQLKKQP
jgi:predicted transcriptional regulator